MTLSLLLRVLGVGAFVVAMLLFLAAFAIGSGFGGLFFVALGLALWLFAEVVEQAGYNRTFSRAQR